MLCFTCHIVFIYSDKATKFDKISILQVKKLPVLMKVKINFKNEGYYIQQLFQICNKND